MQSFILLNSLYRSIKDKVTCISEIKNTLFIALMTNVIWLMMTDIYFYFSDHSYTPALMGFHLWIIWILKENQLRTTNLDDKD